MNNRDLCVGLARAETEARVMEFLEENGGKQNEKAAC